MSNRNSEQPVRPPPKPGQVKVFRAIYDYAAQNGDELSFQEGDIIYVTDMISNQNWWKAKCNGKTGLVPNNYIEENTESLSNPIHEAAKRGNFSFLTECLQNNVSVNSLDAAANTPLHWACYGGHIDCVQELLKSSNIILDLQNKLGDTPLHNASYKNHDQIVKALVDRGARLDILNNDSKAPFDLARSDACRVMLEYKADKTAQMKLDSEYLDNEGEDSD